MVIGRPIRILAIVATASACHDYALSGFTDAASSSDAGTKDALQFRLSRDSTRQSSVFVQSGTLQGGQSWLQLLDSSGKVLALDAACGACFCSDCIACGAACGAGIPVVTEIKPGDHLDLDAAALVHIASTCGSSSTCDAPEALAAGAYTAKFCYSFAADGVGANHQLTPPIACDDVSFTSPTVLPIEDAL